MLSEKYFHEHNFVNFDLRVGEEMPDAGKQMLDAGCWILDV
jgi:hypothetical protein